MAQRWRRTGKPGIQRAKSELANLLRILSYVRLRWPGLDTFARIALYTLLSGEQFGVYLRWNHYRLAIAPAGPGPSLLARFSWSRDVLPGCDEDRILERTHDCRWEPVMGNGDLLDRGWQVYRIARDRSRTGRHPPPPVRSKSPIVADER